MASHLWLYLDEGVLLLLLRDDHLRLIYIARGRLVGPDLEPQRYGSWLALANILDISHRLNHWIRLRVEAIIENHEFIV